ncbi:MAG: CHASE2 domain-containing protein, partial [Cyclobacteriaceae bacterium]
VLNENFEPEEVIKDRILMLGFMGDDFEDRSWQDKFYTPLNIKYAGRTNPDMFGIVVHANIVSMILNGDYINRQSKLSGIIWAIILCLINVYYFIRIYRVLPQWYDGITKSLQLVEILVLLLVNVLLFHWFNYKTDLTLATVCIALSSDGIEIYFGVIKNIFSKEGRQEIFKKKKRVLR